MTPLFGSEFSGPLSMTHVGICTQDGPEQKRGEIRLQISALSSRLDATLLVEGLECTYSAARSDPYSGTMACRDGKAVGPERDAVTVVLEAASVGGLFHFCWQ